MVTMSIDRQHSVQNTIRARALRQRRTDAIVSQLRVARPASPDSRDLTRQLIESNIDMARTVTKRYTGRGIELDDLEQVALLGLTKAARRFDPAAGHDFMAFAVPTIRGELRRYFRDLGWAVKPPRPVQEMQIRIARAQAELAQELQRSPRPTELARHLGEELELVVEALAADGCFTPARSTPRSASTAPLSARCSAVLIGTSKSPKRSSCSTRSWPACLLATAGSCRCGSTKSAHSRRLPTRSAYRKRRSRESWRASFARCAPSWPTRRLPAHLPTPPSLAARSRLRPQARSTGRTSPHLRLWLWSKRQFGRR